MSRIELDEQETEALATALRSYLSELRTEVVGTDSHDFREELKRQEATLKRVLERLEGAAGGAGSP